MTSQKKSEGHCVVVLDEEWRELPDSRIECESLEHAYAVAHQMLASGKRIAIVNADGGEVKP